MKKTHNDSLASKNEEQVELADIFRRYGDDYRQIISRCPMNN